MLYFSTIQNIGIFGAALWWFFQFTSRFILEKNTKKTFDIGLGQNSAAVKAIRLAPLSNADRGPTCQPPGAGDSNTRRLFDGLVRCWPPSLTKGARPDLLTLPRL
jgi:hypothetical protein